MYLISSVIILVAGEMSGLTSFFCGHECPILPASILSFDYSGLSQKLGGVNTLLL